MKPSRHFFCILLALSTPALAIPNQVGGFLAQVESPLNDRDLTEVLLADGLWAGGTELPGNWRDEAPVATVQSSYLLARPKVFGLPVVMLSASHRTGNLDSLAVTFADAGYYFGYLNEKLPEGLSPRKQKEELRRRLTARRDAFQTEFAETLKTLQGQLETHSDRRPRENQIGKTRTLRAEVIDYEKGDLLLRLIVGGDRLIRLLIVPKDKALRGWLDPERASLTDSERSRLFEDRVTKSETGDVRIDQLPLVPQGYRPYCGINTLAMSARYFGLHIDEDWLAVAGKFENTGSAIGAQIPRLYLAVAQEAGLDLHKASDFRLSEARGSLDHGLPVVIWRRFSSERDKLHTRYTSAALRDPEFKLPAPDSATRDSWPDSKAPLHASLIVGYNQERNEVLFQESWANMKTPRRMRAEELEGTAYLTFYFKP